MRPDRISKIPILIHTMDNYAPYWNTWYKLFKKYTSNTGPIYFLTERRSPDFKDDVFHIKSGEGEWGYRLRKGLEQINSELVFYMQEDNWAYAPFEFKQEYLNKFNQLDMQSLIFHACAFGSIQYELVEDNLYKYSQRSPYLMGHHMGLWNKEFFLSNVYDQESPWMSEIQGTPRWYNINHRIYQYDIKWYWSVARRGILQPEGYKILQDNNILDFDDTPIKQHQI